jgi:hypothetical protein
MKEGNRMTDRNLQRGTNKTENTMDRVPSADHLNSDNAFSDNGLKNAQLLDQAVHNKKSK